MIELLARIEAVMRRRGLGQYVLKVGDVSLDLRAHRAERGGSAVELTAREFDLAEFFMRNRDRALFRDTIYERVWGGEYSGDTRTVDLHVMRLRTKLGWEQRLRSIPRIGYCLDSRP